MRAESLANRAYSATIHGLLERWAQVAPDRVAYAAPSGCVTYADLEQRANRLAGSLHRAGIRRGERFIAVMPNGLDMMCLHLALCKLGAVSIFMERGYEAGLFNQLVEAMAPGGVLLDEPNRAKFLTASHPSVRCRVLWGSEGGGEAAFLPFAELASGRPDPFPRPKIDPTSPAQFIFTSGTTGLPKACILSHRARLALGAAINRELEATEDDRFFGCLPNSHGNVFLGILGALLSGGSLVLAERFSARNYWRQAAESGATVLVLHGVPLNILLASEPEQDPPPHGVRAVVTVGGRHGEFQRRFRIPRAVIGYGSTEAGGLVSIAHILSSESGSRPDSYVGQVREDLDVIVANADDEPLGGGATGQILVRPKVPFVISDGYSGQPERTLEVRRNLWLHTGDLGFFDETGGLHFAGRAREAIRVGGEFVAVEYLESLVRSLDAVRDCAVVGMPADIGDEQIVLFVQPREASGLSASDVLEALRPRIPRFMLPKSVTFVSDFPRVPGTLKIQKTKLFLDAGQQVQSTASRPLRADTRIEVPPGDPL